jgi:hypothetical protein
VRVTNSLHLIHRDLIFQNVWSEDYKLWSFSQCIYLHTVITSSTLTVLWSQVGWNFCECLCNNLEEITFIFMWGHVSIIGFSTKVSVDICDANCFCSFRYTSVATIWCAVEQLPSRWQHVMNTGCDCAPVCWTQLINHSARFVAQRIKHLRLYITA